MNGYEKYSRDYGGPPEGSGGPVFTALAILISIATIGWAIWRARG